MLELQQEAIVITRWRIILRVNWIRVCATAAIFRRLISSQDSSRAKQIQYSYFFLECCSKNTNLCVRYFLNCRKSNGSRGQATGIREKINEWLVLQEQG